MSVRIWHRLHAVQFDLEKVVGGNAAHTKNDYVVVYVLADSFLLHVFPLHKQKESVFATASGKHIELERMPPVLLRLLMKSCCLRWYYPEQVHSVGGDEWAT